MQRTARTIFDHQKPVSKSVGRRIIDLGKRRSPSKESGGESSRYKLKTRRAAFRAVAGKAEA
jgi:hypothetical protein